MKDIKRARQMMTMAKNIELVRLLTASNIDFPEKFYPLTNLTDFALDFRYEALEDEPENLN